MNYEYWLKRVLVWYKSQPKKYQEFIKTALAPIGLSFAITVALTTNPKRAIDKWTVLMSIPFLIAFLPLATILVVTGKQ